MPIAAAPRTKLRYERTGAVLEVVEVRPDGWPICPGCGNDELAAIGTLAPEPELIDLCYVCGRVEVLPPARAALSS